MKKMTTMVLTVVLTWALMLSSSFADVLTMSGTVVNIQTENINTAFGGTVGQVHVSAGDRVQAGETLVTLNAEKVYALEDGTVRLFGDIGDSADSLTSRYGAVAYIEPDCQYTISASTKNAYDDEENKIIHPGEEVYLKSVKGGQKTGTGIVTSVNGSSYNIEIISGDLESGTSVYVYRNEDYSVNSRIGRGSVSHQDPVAYTGSGIVVSYQVENGNKVHKGDLLFETLSGSYSNQKEKLCEITAEKDGVIASISLNTGASLSEGAAIAEFYADDNLRIKASVTEEELQYYQINDDVEIKFTYLDNGEYSLKGTIEKISRTSLSTDEETSEASYAVLVRPESTERLYYGMNAVIEKENGSSF